ncbi:hypothetical protein Q5692_39080 [Microcoleus sp. C2C3]|uniref:hypothetical protein n=1 Tax=unclassified Microcoleus TaxID=2642155 RepID=UPI002FD79EB4
MRAIILEANAPANANLKLLAIDLDDCDSQTIARKGKGGKLLQVYLPLGAIAKVNLMPSTHSTD